MVVNIFEYVDIRHTLTVKGKDKFYYRVSKQFNYYSKRYDKWVMCEVGMVSDGATNAIDINSAGWLVHDKLCNTGLFADGSICSNWQASMILSDILASEGRFVRKITWKYATFLFGGGVMK